MIDIQDLQKKCFDLAKEKGFFDPSLSDIEYHMMAVGELSEAVDEMRTGTPPIYWKVPVPKGEIGLGFTTKQDHPDKEKKPEGELIELADTILRILSYCGHKGYDMEKAIAIKHEYNKTRLYKHGKKF